MNKRVGLCLFLVWIRLFLFSLPLTAAAEIRVTVLYDNSNMAEGVHPDWGFSCLIQGTAKTILFDTGARADILRENVGKLKVDLGGVEMIVLSHLHGDHTGGIEWMLSQKGDIPVYLPAMAGDEYMAKILLWGGRPIRVKEPLEVCSKVFVTGELPADFDPAFTEQALVFKAAPGLLVITGCAHPGIVALVRSAGRAASGIPRVLLGGFHLLNKKDTEVADIIAELKTTGVERCGASHCTGERAIALFKEAFADRFLTLGVGSVLSFAWQL